MGSNWVNALDACAAAGVIDYDAPSFILGKNPRYIGHPEFESLPLKNNCLLPPGTKLNDLPQTDTYNSSGNNEFIQNPAWKKILFAGILLTGIIAGGIGISKIGKFNIPKISLPKFPSVKAKITNTVKTAYNIVKSSVAGIFKKIKP